MGKSAARFDFAKLEDLNAHYIRATPDAELVSRIRDVLPVLEGGKEIAEKLEAAHGWPKLERAMPGLKERARTLRELVDGAAYIYAARPLALDDKAEKLLDAGTRTAIGKLVPRLEAIKDWEAPTLEAEVRTFAEETGAKLGKVAQPLRAALTGRSVSPPVFDVMAVLGREEALARLREQAR
jgi:glutamyl-tRNA synthetase